jgi:hypothetical protein
VNTFNRIVVVLLAIAALIVAASIGINGGPTTGPILPVLTRLVSISPDGLIPAAAFIAAVALLILFIELRPQHQAVVRGTLDGASVDYDASAVGRLLARELSRLDDVIRAEVLASGRNGKVNVLVKLETSGAADPRQVATHGLGRVREVVQHSMGLELDQVRLSLRTGEPARSDRQAAVVAPSATPARTS